MNHSEAFSSRVKKMLLHYFIYSICSAILIKQRSLKVRMLSYHSVLDVWPCDLECTRKHMLPVSGGFLVTVNDLLSLWVGNLFNPRAAGPWSRAGEWYFLVHVTALLLLGKLFIGYLKKKTINRSPYQVYLLIQYFNFIPVLTQNNILIELIQSFYIDDMNWLWEVLHVAYWPSKSANYCSNPVKNLFCFK
jgi:hypothetical protein